MKRNLTYLEHEIAEKWSNIDFIILNFTGIIYSSNRIKIINSSKRKSISEALNEAVSSCSGEHILIINEEILDIRCLNELLNRYIKHNFLSKPYFISNNLFNCASVYSSTKDWLERIGGFDGQFLMDRLKDDNELEFVINSLNYKMRLLNQASVLFNANLEQMRCLKKSANMIYECQINKERFILRLIERPPEFAQFVMGEIDWINYLADNGINVSRAIPSLHGDYVAVIKDESSCFFASCFMMSKGRHVNPDNPHEWNDLLFETWGQILGKMHTLSKNYIIKDLSTSRPEWNHGPLFSPDLDLGPSEDKILKMWRNLLSELESLPKDKDSYGLVHNDLHQKNFLIDGSNIIVIDFEGCAFNWFACDIAFLLYHTIYTFKSTRYSFEEPLIRSFFKGYVRENTIDDYWINLIPKFLRFAEIYMYLEKYLFYHANWNTRTLYLGQMDDLRRQKSRIENEVPCVDVDFNNILNDLSG